MTSLVIALCVMARGNTINPQNRIAVSTEVFAMFPPVATRCPVLSYPPK